MRSKQRLTQECTRSYSNIVVHISVPWELYNTVRMNLVEKVIDLTTKERERLEVYSVQWRSRCSKVSSEGHVLKIGGLSLRNK